MAVQEEEEEEDEDTLREKQVQQMMQIAKDATEPPGVFIFFTCSYCDHSNWQHQKNPFIYLFTSIFFLAFALDFF